LATPEPWITVNRKGIKVVGRALPRSQAAPPASRLQSTAKRTTSMRKIAEPKKTASSATSAPISAPLQQPSQRPQEVFSFQLDDIKQFPKLPKSVIKIYFKNASYR
jgi:hypothetical protein